MKSLRFILPVLTTMIIFSCGRTEKTPLKLSLKRPKDISEVVVPVDKGFSDYIAGYTSGIVSVNSSVEIRFTPEFATGIKRKNPTGLFIFEPAIKGNAEWTDELTLVFRPAKPLDPGTLYSGKLNLDRLGQVKDNLKTFPIWIQTIKKDFIVTTGMLESSREGDSYKLHGQITASDYIASQEVESYLQAKIGRKKMPVVWDHSDMLIHRFTVTGLNRSDSPRKLELSWDGSPGKVRQKGNTIVQIPALDDFSVRDIIIAPGGNRNIDIVFSDPLDQSQDTEGIIWLSPSLEMSVSISSNVVSLFPVSAPEGPFELNVETSLKNKKGASLTSAFRKQIDLFPIPPSIELTGNGVIVPSSKELIFPFKAANLKAVDLKIIKIFDNNLPWFLQENDINTAYSVKRFGRPVYSGKLDLVNPAGSGTSGWNLYTVDLSEYIDIEPGILYRVELSMQPSYSLYPCSDPLELGKYEEMIKMTEELSRSSWDDPDNFYFESDDYIYYSFGFNWRERDNPCKVSYFNPDRKIRRNILASNFGIMAKKGSGNDLNVIVSDLLTALPLSEVDITVYNMQIQQIASGITGKDGSVKLRCDGNPFLIIARKDRDRNYLKITDGSALSMSSFDVSGVTPENGIKAFIFGERDVWRPGDSIFLSVFIRDMNNSLPPDHPVQFELSNPLSQKIDHQVQIPGGKQLLTFRTATSPDAVTGDYTARFSIGGAKFTKRVRVETIKPNRLHIDLKFPGEMLGGTGSSTKGTLKVKWLNGATAGNLKSSVEYMLKPSVTSFKSFPNYNFDDPSIQFYSETTGMFEGSVDDGGNASVIFNPGDEIRAPGMMNVVFTSRVAEKGGDESITQTVYKYAPYKIFAGIELPGMKENDRMLFTDRENKVNIATVDPLGNPVNTEADINVYRISYSWWWESDREDLAAYISNNIYKPVISSKIVTSGGKGSFSFSIPRNDWGRYLIRVSIPGGHSTGKIVLIDWPWEYGMKRNAEGATLLSVSTDREKYNPGDEVKLSFPAPENSRIIVTLENSSSVLEEIRAIGQKGNNVVTFKAKPGMAPNVYANVTVIQPHAQTYNDMPIRLYGVVPVMVEDPATRLEPVITMPNQLRSGQQFELKVHEAGKKPMSYTLAIVDEGLLNITGFRTPDPWKYFYAREALGVRTWDLYDMVLGAFGGTLDRLLATGGDEMLIDRTANKAQRFTPVVKFLGPFTLGQGKTATHLIALPQYTGSVRAMVVAGNDRAYGFTETSVPVKDPLMILATAPRVVSPGEKVALPVTLFVQIENIRNVNLSVESNELVSFSESSKSIAVAGSGEKDVDFLFTAGEKTGTATIKLKASGGGETAVYDISLDVRSPNPPETRAELRILKPGEKWETSFTPFGMAGTNSATLETSLLPSVNLGKRLSYLIEYPHGCTEQVISAALPQIWLNELSGSGDADAARAQDYINEAINKIVTRQMGSGGLAVWPGNYQPDNWVTSYAGHFMAEAERKGYTIPQDFRKKWTSYQKNQAQGWKYDPKFRHTANDQAYRLFTLALAGSPERGAMNRLRESRDIPQLARWLLAAAYAVSGRPEASAELLDMRKLETESEYYGWYYGSQLRDNSIILYTLATLKKEEEALPLLRQVCDELNSESWFSTQSVAWGLFAYMKYAELVSPNSTGDAAFRVTYNGQGYEEKALPGKLITRSLKADVPGKLVAENLSDKPLYFNLVRKGTPLISDQSAAENGLSLRVDYTDTGLKPVDHRSLVQGTDFMMVTKVTNTSFDRLDNIALTQMLPSGWEILNTRMFETSYGIEESAYDYRDIRDDRVNTYFSLNRGESKTFVIILNAAYKGEYNQPAIVCEAMYTPDCRSRIPGTRVVVTGQ